VLGLVLRAKESGCKAVVFARDQDAGSESGEERAREIKAGIDEAKDIIESAPPIVGGVAVLRLESWLLAYAGVRNTEGMSAPKVDKQLELHEVSAKDTRSMVELIERCSPTGVAPDA